MHRTHRLRVVVIDKLRLLRTMSKQDRVQINVRLSVEDKARIEEAARRDRRTISGYIRAVLLDHIEHTEKAELQRAA